MRKILYSILLLSSISFASCNDEKEDEPEVDTFDYTFLDEQLDKQGLKIYEGDKETFYDINLPVGQGGHPTSYSYWSLRIRGPQDEFLWLSWEDKGYDIEGRNDTLPLDYGWRKSNPDNSLTHKFASKAIVVIHSLKYRPKESYTPKAKYDSISVEGAFNLQFKNEGTEQMVKGVFYYQGEVEELF